MSPERFTDLCLVQHDLRQPLQNMLALLERIETGRPQPDLFRRELGGLMDLVEATGATVRTIMLRFRASAEQVWPSSLETEAKLAAFLVASAAMLAGMEALIERKAPLDDASLAVLGAAVLVFRERAIGFRRAVNAEAVQPTSPRSAISLTRAAYPSATAPSRSVLLADLVVHRAYAAHRQRSL